MEGEHITSGNKRYCLSALSLGLKYYSQVFPNPPVGAILVKNKKVVSRGAHKKAGTSHAEVNAINLAGAEARDSDLYVSLEPCNHFGKTPPCTKLIVESGIKRVYYLIKDQTKASGGADYLRSQGVEVHWIEPTVQILKYLEPWKTYEQDNVVSLTPIFFLDLGGKLVEVPALELKERIIKRFQKVIREETEISVLNAYDVSFLISNQRDYNHFIAMKSKSKIRINKILIARTMQYVKNVGDTSDMLLDTFGILDLHRVNLLKEICLEEYEHSYV